jgi:tyrosine-protein kinase Etk/Wzc
MSQLPTRRDLSEPRPLTSRGAGVDAPGEELQLHQVLGFFRRNRWLLLIGLVVGVALGVFSTLNLVPVYQSVATIQIDSKERNLPGIYKDLASSGRLLLLTEAEVLSSRSLAEDAVRSMGLQVRVVEPTGLVRSKVMSNLEIQPGAGTGLYLLRRLDPLRFELLDEGTSRVLDSVRVGGIVRVEGVSFRLEPEAATQRELKIAVHSFDGVVSALQDNFDVYQPERDAHILRVNYRDADRELAAEVPNLIVSRFVERQQNIDQVDARNTVQFLRHQLDTVSAQLEAAESALRNYRERHRVINPQAEASGEISRLTAIQSQRLSIEAERMALAGLLEAVDAKAARQREGAASAYRELMAFPTLLQNRAASEVLDALSRVEQERATLLARRTPQDPDARALTERIEELEQQLRGVAVTYLQSLSNQSQSLERNIEIVNRQLAAIPERELQVAQLQRPPKVLEEMYSLLQTRLKEAEIAATARDASIRLVDPAIPPRYPQRSTRFALIFAGAVGGLLVGSAAAFAREIRDRAMHTRNDLQRVTGLPVLGLIPRIPQSRSPIALIAERRPLDAPAPAPAVLPAQPGVRRRGYTFLQDETEDPVPESAPALLASAASPPAIPLRRMQLALSDVGSVVVEAYSILQTNLAFCRAEEQIRVLVMTSALPGEGKTTSSINLALTLAHRGLRVLLVDADMRRGVLHTLFDVPRSPGLSEVLRGSVTLGHARGSTLIAQGQVLHYLTAGAVVPVPAGLIESDAMRQLVQGLRSEYDFIILDAPPANVVTDAALLASMADGMLLVVRSGVTEPGALVVALEQLEHVRAPLLGLVLNDIDPKRDAAYGGSYRYYNYHSYAGPAAS